MKKALIILVLIIMLTACVKPPPRSETNVCRIFHQYPTWYWDTQATQRKWGVPISVQMAIIHEESHFRMGAKPGRRKLLGFIPWARKSTADGYAQVLNQTWRLYLRETHQHSAPRWSFAKATDFIGWYAARAQRRLGIAKTNAYALYLAYHEGLLGYQQKTYLHKAWLVDVAKRVQQYADRYRWQLRKCHNRLPRKPWYRFW